MSFSEHAQVRYPLALHGRRWLSRGQYLFTARYTAAHLESFIASMSCAGNGWLRLYTLIPSGMNPHLTSFKRYLVNSSVFAVDLKPKHRVNCLVVRAVLTSDRRHLTFSSHNRADAKARLIVDEASLSPSQMIVSAGVISGDHSSQ